MRSLDEWLAYQAQVHPLTIDLGLDRPRQVLERLHWRQPSAAVISVAGTNGKGSVSEYCTAMLSAAGHRVGTFTSPHLHDYRERIRLNGRLVTDDELVSAFERIEAARCDAAGPISLTFFEFNALAAFLIFEAAQLDAWVLEVGMGGRLDAVNIVDPTVAVVVSIGLDHQQFLGTTLDAIAREKAGIFRPGRTAVLGSRRLPPILRETATALGAAPKQLGAEFDYARSPPMWRYHGSRWQWPDLPAPALCGEVQVANAAVAIAALEELEPLRMTPAAAASGLRAMRLAGRFQVIPPVAGGPTWILDVAHNRDAALVLAENLRALPATGQTFAVCGILADKDARAIAAVVGGLFDHWWLASIEGDRGTPAPALSGKISAQVAAPVSLAEDIGAACSAARAAAGPRDRIVVFGSFHSVGPALEWLALQGVLPRTERPEYTAARSPR